MKSVDAENTTNSIATPLFVIKILNLSPRGLQSREFEHPSQADARGGYWLPLQSLTWKFLTPTMSKKGRLN